MDQIKKIYIIDLFDQIKTNFLKLFLRPITHACS
jgi:hypothetical protein